MIAHSSLFMNDSPMPTRLIFVALGTSLRIRWNFSRERLVRVARQEWIDTEGALEVAEDRRLDLQEQGRASHDGRLAIVIARRGQGPGNAGKSRSALHTEERGRAPGD